MKEQPKSRENSDRYIPDNSKNGDGTIFQFLQGSHSYEGVWFGEKHPTRGGNFWWRSVLREYLESGEPPKPEQKWIDVKTQKPQGDALLMTSSRIIIIGDWYDGEWRTHRSTWVDGRLVSAFKENDIIAWQPLPETQVWRPLYEEFESVSGEAKTPDQIDEITNAGDLFGGIMPMNKHETGNLKKCKICYDLADKYWGVGNDHDGGLKMQAVDFAHFVIEQLQKELTSGSVPTPDSEWMEAHNILVQQNIEMHKIIAEMSVPTPSDQEISEAALKYKDYVNGDRSDACGFTEGVRWALLRIGASKQAVAGGQSEP